MDRSAAPTTEPPDHEEEIAARLYRAGLPGRDLYALIGLRPDADQEEVDRRIARARRMVEQGRASERAAVQVPLLERVLGDPAVRRVYDRERRLAREAREDSERAQAPRAEAPPPPVREHTPSAGAQARAAAQQALMRRELSVAVEWAREAMEVEPNAASAVTLSSVLRRTGDLAAAEEAARRAIEMAPGAPETHDALARVLLDGGDVEEAAAIVERVLAEHPDDPGAKALARRLGAEGSAAS